MSEIVLNAEIRQRVGKRSKLVRNEGKVPGVFYAHGQENVSIEVARLHLDPLIHTSETHIIDLRLQSGEQKKCILRDVQFDPVTDRAVHFDLQGLLENEKLTIDVPIALTGGIPKGVRDGGTLQHIMHKIKVSCLPKDIPEKVEINVAELAINHSIHVKDLQIPNVTVLESPESPVVAVVPPTVLKEAEPGAAAEDALKEPEVVGKGKKVEEGAEEGEAAPKEKEKEEKKK